MSYQVHLKRSAEKELEQLPAKLHDKIVQRLLELQENPFPKNIKKLQGRDGFRIRVGDYRILYQLDEITKTIEIISIAHRKEVYR